MSILGTSNLKPQTSNFEVFGLDLGGNTFGGTTSEATSYGVLDAFVEDGGNFVDSAGSYPV